MGVLEVEPDAAAAALLPGAQFADAYRLAIDEAGIDAMAAAGRAFGRSPRWVGALMALRALIVAPFGLRSGLGRREDAAVGAFPVLAHSPERVVLGLDDKHLDFRVAVDLPAIGDGRRQVTVTTLVRTHNLFGRAYLATILPFHRMIVPAMLAQVTRR